MVQNTGLLLIHGATCQYGDVCHCHWRFLMVMAGSISLSFSLPVDLMIRIELLGRTHGLVL